MCFWSRGLSGEGSRRQREEEPRHLEPPAHPQPSTPSFCARELLFPRSSITISYKQKNAHGCPPAPSGAHTAREGPWGILEELGCRCEKRGICTALLTSFEIKFPSRDFFFDHALEKSGPCNAHIPCAGIFCHLSGSSFGHLVSGQRWQQWLRADWPQAFLARAMSYHLNINNAWMLYHVDERAFPLTALGLFLFVLCLSLCAPVSPSSTPFCLPSLYRLSTQDIFQTTKCGNTFITPG